MRKPSVMITKNKQNYNLSDIEKRSCGINQFGLKSYDFVNKY